jgi:selenocysteine lyase/cysteine desulfurase
MGENERSGIITFVSEKYDYKYLFNILKKNKILVAMRRERIRLSPHFYNCEEDIEQVIDVLP